MAGLYKMEDITKYCKVSESIILFWSRELNFPAVKIKGMWISDTELIDRWRQRLINNRIAVPLLD